LKGNARLARLAIEVRNLEMWRLVGCDITVDRLAEAIKCHQYFMMSAFLDILVAEKCLTFSHELCKRIAKTEDVEDEILAPLLTLIP
jgi:hypothetical protein